MANDNDIPGEITGLLNQIRAGDSDAEAEVVDLIYAELRKMASGMFANEREGHTLSATALVNEALLRLLREGTLAETENRRHLFGIAANLMWQILVEHARRRNTVRRGRGWQRVPLDEVIDRLERQEVDVFDLHAALDELGGFAPRQRQVIILRHIFEFTGPEVAHRLDVSQGTVERDARIAKAWLYEKLNETGT